MGTISLCKRFFLFLSFLFVMHVSTCCAGIEEFIEASSAIKDRYSDETKQLIVDLIQSVLENACEVFTEKKDDIKKDFAYVPRLGDEVIKEREEKARKFISFTVVNNYLSKLCENINNSSQVLCYAILGLHRALIFSHLCAKNLRVSIPYEAYHYDKDFLQMITVYKQLHVQCLGAEVHWTDGLSDFFVAIVTELKKSFATVLTIIDDSLSTDLTESYENYKKDLKGRGRSLSSGSMNRPFNGGKYGSLNQPVDVLEDIDTLDISRLQNDIKVLGNKIDTLLTIQHGSQQIREEPKIELLQKVFKKQRKELEAEVSHEAFLPVGVVGLSILESFLGYIAFAKLHPKMPYSRKAKQFVTQYPHLVKFVRDYGGAALAACLLTLMARYVKHRYAHDTFWLIM